ncbi:hypothetical protein AB1N83_008922 [Pleurotus pulmonarius]
MNVECLDNVPRAVKRTVGFAPPYLRFEASEGQQEVSLRRLCCLSFHYLERSFRARQIAGGIAAADQASKWVGIFRAARIPEHPSRGARSTLPVHCHTRECSVLPET